jgi:hypothetical protein
MISLEDRSRFSDLTDGIFRNVAFRTLLQPEIGIRLVNLNRLIRLFRSCHDAGIFAARKAAERMTAAGANLAHTSACLLNSRNADAADSDCAENSSGALTGCCAIDADCCPSVHPAR